jgi:hypothetical protein
MFLKGVRLKYLPLIIFVVSLFANGNSMDKNFKLNTEDIEDIAKGNGSCIATDKITVEGKIVGYMYREAPSSPHDSGWVFMSGYETQEYMDEPNNHAIYDVNTIANYDREIIPLLKSPVGSSFERNEFGKFVEIKE